MVSARATTRETLLSRITFYTLQGTMADGAWVHVGAAACGYGIDLGSWVHIVEADAWVVCEDRGALGWTQIDVWACCGRPAWLWFDWSDIEVY